MSWVDDKLKAGGGGGALQYIYALQKGVAQSALASPTNKLLLGGVLFDATVLPVVSGKTRKVFFEAIIETSNASNVVHVDLYDFTASAALASSDISTAALIPAFVNVELTALASLASGFYQARMWMAPQDPAQLVTCLHAALVVKLV